MALSACQAHVPLARTQQQPAAVVLLHPPAGQALDHSLTLLVLVSGTRGSLRPPGGLTAVCRGTAARRCPAFDLQWINVGGKRCPPGWPGYHRDLRALGVRHATVRRCDSRPPVECRLCERTTSLDTLHDG